MLQVNFLPWRVERQRRQIKLFVVLILSYLACAIAVLALVYLSVSHQQHFLAGSLAEVVGVNQQMAQKIAEINSYQKELTTLDSYQQETRNIKQSGVNLEQLFSYFEQTLTPEVGLKRIDISGSRLSIEGQGRGYLPVVDFYRKVEIMPLVHEAQLGKVSLSTTDNQLFVFSLEAELAGALP